MSAVPSVVFTGPDKALLDRSARAAEAAAKALNWEAIVLPKLRKKAKLEYDRLMRDAHDLRLMGVRLTKYQRALPKVVPFPPSHTGLSVAPAVIAERRANAIDRRRGERRLRQVAPLMDHTDRREDVDRRAGGDRRRRDG